MDVKRRDIKALLYSGRKQELLSDKKKRKHPLKRTFRYIHRPLHRAVLLRPLLEDCPTHYFVVVALLLLSLFICLLSLREKKRKKKHPDVIGGENGVRAQEGKVKVPQDDPSGEKMKS